MRKQDEIRIVLGNKRYVGSSNQPVQLQLPLKGDVRNFVQGDRSNLVDLQDIFNRERQSSNTFRLAGKIVNIFDNSVSGRTNYTPFKNSLYYVDPQISVTNNIWQGFPPYQEFEFIRESMISGHVPFVSKSSTTYNWSIYTSYAFSSTTAQTMSYTNEKFNVTVPNFNVSEGIPFVISNGTFNGKDLVYFNCATEHNLSSGEFVKLNISIDGKNVFQVFDLGDGTYNSEKKIFSIYDLKFTPASIQTGTYGNFKRIITITNSAETESRYYIRLHKILTGQDETFLTKMAFENNPFPVKKKLELSGLTPNNVQRVSVKDGRQSYGFSINKDINIENLIDNNGKPISELFITIINKGYGGWFNNPALSTNSAIDIGWEFNITKDQNNPWWTHSSTVNKDNIPFSFYQLNNNTFFYNQTLNVGDVIKGSFCEYNDIEQREYVLSDLFHKYSFNYLLFSNSQINQNAQTGGGGFGNINLSGLLSDPELPQGYLYKPHYSIPIKAFSDYIETAPINQVTDVPFYAFYSNENQQLLWRDIYTYGYVDSDGIGYNYPFINNAHYPFKDVLFIQYPINRDINGLTGLITNLPTTDECE
jgi:hypothetical protein